MIPSGEVTWYPKAVNYSEGPDSYQEVAGGRRLKAHSDRLPQKDK